MSDSGGPPVDDVDDVPTVSCSRCDEEWSLAYELDELAMGNRAVEAFAIDHQQHTGHFPDGVTPWVAACRRCPEAVERLEESGARRWARTHARHTGHAVDLDHASRDDPERVER
ncbi:hypothetical protein [Halorarius halobius]|uniref:hypothetical protein n=1 Tax=Halorarius halobius TaxID=2962671 RepID=UPI0020CF3275|nr:hypothetical protein [Halorarius halobius]